MQRLAEIGINMAQQVTKIAQAYTDYQTSGELPPDLRELFLDVADLAREGAAELEKIQLDSQATPGRC